MFPPPRLLLHAQNDPLKDISDDLLIASCPHLRKGGEKGTKGSYDDI